ncbi:hypothetical protein ACJVC5_10880 [Peredibacter sp. HCB2-198]|uniref:hypothetical protein n=1 Tax=Peredibacter sp. HCB2-198 TaxID=3383025 RepID=UPI0038B5B348
MNWKNISLEKGFIKQELNFNGNKVINYIPLCQVDSFGIVSTENKRWLYAGFFFLACALIMAFAQSFQGMMLMGFVATGLICIYFMTKTTWFNITSSQTKFSVQVSTTKEEIQAVNAFIEEIKHNICVSENIQTSKAA